MKEENIKISKHPNWSKNCEKTYFLPQSGVKKLIIGTMPPYRFCEYHKKINNNYPNGRNDFDFFYGSKDNYFWTILENITSDKFKYKLNNPNNCQKFLEEYHIGIIDIVQECIHNNPYQKKEPSAADDDLLSIKPNKELLKILKEHNNITLYCTSKYALTLLKIFYATYIKYDEKNHKGIIKFKDLEKEYNIYVLYSPTKRIFYRFKNDIEKQYKNLIN